MDTWLKFALLLVAAYLLGSVPSSYLVARSRGVDLRQQGTDAGRGRQPLSDHLPHPRPDCQSSSTFLRALS